MIVSQAPEINEKILTNIPWIKENTSAGDDMHGGNIQVMKTSSAILNYYGNGQFKIYFLSSVSRYWLTILKIASTFSYPVGRKK